MSDLKLPQNPKTNERKPRGSPARPPTTSSRPMEFVSPFITMEIVLNPFRLLVLFLGSAFDQTEPELNWNGLLNAEITANAEDI